MNVVLWLLALVTPGLFGTALIGCFSGRPLDRSGWIGALGAGYVLGSVLWGGLLRWIPLPLSSWPWLLLPMWLGIAGCWVWLRRQPAQAQGPAWRYPPANGRQRTWVIAMMLVLTALWLTMLLQAASLPTLVWDAWSVWMSKPKAWMAAGQWLPTMDFEPWWRAPEGSSIYAYAASYPESIPRFSLWLAVAWGRWDESVVGLAWPMLWLALGMMAYGYSRTLSVRPWQAVTLVFALLTLPLLVTHATLYGYSDLWLAAVLALAGLHGLRALRLHSRGDALLAVLVALLLPMVKTEGGVWLLCFAATVAYAITPQQLRRLWAIAALLVLAIAVLFGRLALPVPGLGWVSFEWGAVSIPGMGRLSLHWREVGGPVAQSLWLLPNWMLLWWLAPMLLLGTLGKLRRLPSLRIGGVFLLFGYGFLVMLFFFTDASRWAESLTSLNRVLLHIVPFTVIWLGFLLTAPPELRDTSR